VCFDQAVLAHELGHLKCDHGVWLTFANILTMGAYTVPGTPSIFFLYSREAVIYVIHLMVITCVRSLQVLAWLLGSWKNSCSGGCELRS
jgi:Zn-dependent protease with chaperone function